jgi:hypothetical protein
MIYPATLASLPSSPFHVIAPAKVQTPLVTKVEVARRQLNCAIRLHYSGEDPLPVHTIIAAGFRIVRDLAEQSGEVRIWRQLKALFRPGMEKAFWKEHVATANFLKHADRDPDATHPSVTTERNERDLLFACMSFLDLSEEWSFEMAIHYWIAIWAHPEMLDRNSMPKGVADKFTELVNSLPVDTIAARLKLGRRFLALPVHLRPFVVG